MDTENNLANNASDSTQELTYKYAKLTLPSNSRGFYPDKTYLGIKKMLERRRYFGRAAASLENQLKDPKYIKLGPSPKLVNIGITGEKKTSLILREWVNRHPDAVLIDSISLPLNKKEYELEDELDEEAGVVETGDTDHLIIIGNTLIIIDSKNWKAKANYNVEEDLSITRSKKHFFGSRPKARQMKHLWKKYFEDYDIDEILMFVCISDPDTFITRNRFWWQLPFRFVNQTTLVQFLDEMYDEDIDDDSKNFIRIDLVTRALTGLVKPYNAFKERFPNAYASLGRK